MTTATEPVQSPHEDDSFIEDFKAAADRYLRERHTTLWGEKFSIWQDEGRARAVDWITGVLIGIATEMDEAG